MNKKRMVALFLVAALVLAFAPVSALAEEEMQVIEPQDVVEAEQIEAPVIEGQEDEYVPVTGIMILSENIYVKDLTAAITMEVEVYPENATNKTVKWTVGDGKVAEVKDVDGVVTLSFVGYGETTLTVETLDPMTDPLSDSISVSVSPDSYGPQGRGGNTLEMVSPGDVMFIGEDDLEYYNALRQPVSVTEPMQFKVVLANDMRGVDFDFVSENIMPKISVTDTAGNVVLAYDQVEGMYLRDYDEASNVITIELPEYSIAPNADYELVFEGGICGKDAGRTLGKNVVFGFAANENSDIRKITGLEATQTTDSITVTWTPANRIDGYFVYMDGWQYLAVSSETPSCEIEELGPGEVHDIQVTAYVIGGDGDDVDYREGPRSDVLKTGTQPERVTGLKAPMYGRYEDSIELKWDRVESATHYSIIMNGEEIAVVESDDYVWAAPDYTVVGLRPGSRCTFKVTSMVRDGNLTIYGTNTGNIVAYTAPSAPMALSVTKRTSTSVKMHWWHPQEANVTHYRIYVDGKKVATVRADNSIVKQSLPVPKSHDYTIKNLKPGTNYTIRVCAVIRSGGTSVRGASAWHKVTTLK